MSKARKLLVSLVAFAAMMLGTVVGAAPGWAAPPGPGSKLCSPGQNNVGGGAGNSGPGDKAGAPLKPSPHCPGNG